ncbi:MAG: tRNA-dihydrouridine synthase [Desulfosarcinaceae bacterium]
MDTFPIKKLAQPLQIGAKTIPNRLVLAPMTFLGHVAFRQLLDELGGCGLMFSEMCSAARIPGENRYISDYFKWRDEERAGLVVQIVGADAERMAAAAGRIEAEGFFGVDINLGCAVKGICRYNQGAALLKTPDLAVHMVREVRQRVNCPVTVKFRTGWQDDPQIPVDLARRLEEAGADALTFHPRLAPDRRTRPPKWEYIGRVKQAVSIPVFGNGDVFDAQDCRRMLETTGCDGVALGRIAIARPWVFAQWTRGTEPPEDIPARSAVRLLGLTQTHFGGVRALRRFKRYAVYLAANFTFGNSLYNRLRNAGDFNEMAQALETFFATNPVQRQHPNLMFMR